MEGEVRILACLIGDLTCYAQCHDRIIDERIVFEPYTREMYETTHRWMVGHRLFDGAESIRPDYEMAVI